MIMIVAMLQLQSGDEGGAGAITVVGSPFVYYAIHELWRLVRPPRWLEVSSTGLAVGAGRNNRHLAWSEIARVRSCTTGNGPGSWSR